MDRDDELLRASEVGQYAFCARSWWLARVVGLRPANVAALRHGRERHRSHGRGVSRANRLRRLAVCLLLLAAALLAAYMLFLGMVD